MDRTIKFLLGVIAASLLMLNLQLGQGILDHQTIHVQFSGNEFEGIANAIRSRD